LAAAPHPLPAEPVPLHDALGRALRQNLVAPADLPPFDNSAVDGFAARLSDTRDATPARPVTLRVTQSIPAGHAPTGPVGPGEAARIYTGAPLPSGANGLVMVEDTEAGANETIRILAPATPDHIRAKGSDLPLGGLALRAGVTLDASALGLLAALNVSAPVCARRPRVGLLTTGDEIIAAGETPLAPGQIRDANGPALLAAVSETGAVVSLHRHARDREEDVRAALDACAAAGCDVILASGGVSVGDYDVVKAVVASVGALDFWRIAIKPGKPLAFGRVGANALSSACPGTPFPRSSPLNFSCARCYDAWPGTRTFRAPSFPPFSPPRFRTRPAAASLFAPAWCGKTTLTVPLRRARKPRTASPR
jgi:molybdopterin molybdotransferase